MDIVGRRNWYFLLSLAIILPGIVSMAVFGFRLGIDFAGGDQYNLAFTRPVQATTVQKEMDTFNVEATVQQAGPSGVLITTKPLSSVHDTIVIFDRIRENLRQASRLTFEQNVNLSIIQSLARSVNTSMTVVFVLVALFLISPQNIKGLTLALLIGIVSGTYSSIFNASPLLVVWRRLDPR